MDGDSGRARRGSLVSELRKTFNVGERMGVATLPLARELSSSEGLRGERF